MNGKECARPAWLERRESYMRKKARRLREVIDSVVNKSNQRIAIKSKFREFIFPFDVRVVVASKWKIKSRQKCSSASAQSRKRLLQKSHDITRDVYKNKYH